MPDDYTTPSKTDEGGSGQNILWTSDFKCPENAMILRRQVPVDVQNEDRFSPRNTFAFNPLAQELFSYDNGVLAAVLLLMAKKDPKSVERLATKLITSVGNLLEDILQSGKTNPLSAINSHTTFACVAHRFGIIDDSHYLKIVDQTRSIIDKIIQLSAADIAASGVLNGLSVFAEGGKRGARSTSGLSRLSNLLAVKP